MHLQSQSHWPVLRVVGTPPYKDSGFMKCLFNMTTFSALLAICAGNSPVTGEFPAQRPATRSVDVYFDLRRNKRLSKQSQGWWFETRRAHYDAIVMGGCNQTLSICLKIQICSVCYVDSPRQRLYFLRNLLNFVFNTIYIRINANKTIFDGKDPVL